MSELKKIPIKLFGDTYMLRTDKTEVYMKKLVTEMEIRIKDMRRNNPSLTQSKAALLLALDSLDEKQKWQKKYEAIVNELESLNIDF